MSQNDGKKRVLMEHDLGQPGRVASLDENGNLPAAQMGNLTVGGAAHMTQDGSAVKITAVGENLLDNCDFTNPVNQRGHGELSVSGFMIDRWYFSTGSGAKITLKDNGIHIQSLDSGAAPYIRQVVENYKALAGKKVTLSAVVSEAGGTGADTRGYGYMQIFADGNAVPGGVYMFHNTGLISLTTTLPDVINDNLRVVLAAYWDDYVTYRAVKFELGDTQTLAHNEGTEDAPIWVLNEIPDYGEELAKCQRYFERVYLPAGFTIPARGENNLYANLFFKAEKRATPTGIGYPMYVVKASNNTGVYGAFVNAVPDLTRISKDVCSVRFLDTQVNSIPLGETAYLSTNTGAVLYFDVDAEL